jgi:peptidoglycan/LPS O-acetylase OafA/YrhL
VLRDAFFAMTQTSAFAQAAGVEVAASFAPTWSLTVEWTFYLSFPLTLWWFRRVLINPSRVWRLLAAAAALLYVAGLLLSHRLFYLLPVANLGVLYAGGALAIWHVGRSSEFEDRRSDSGRTGMALLLLTVLVFLPGHTLGWGWKASVFPATVFATLTVIHGCWAGDAATRLLARGPLPVVGLRAYSLYLWHMPILWLVWVVLPGLPRWAMAGLALAIVGMVTECSFCLLERPVLGGASRQPRARR